LRLLLVDDDAVNQLVTTSALHRVGYNVEVAHNGHRAIELTEGERWDLILMDMQMPDLDGCRTTSAIRARERGAWRTPIRGLTAHADQPEAAGDDGVVPLVPEGPAIDLEQLEAACMGLPALRSSLLHTYLIDVPGRLERLRFAFGAGDLRRVEFEAHGLRGMCATIGAAGCTLLFGEMEERAR